MTSFWKQFRDNPQVRAFYLDKIKIIQLCREFFLRNKFQELEAPLLNAALLPESYVDVFATEGKRRTAQGTTKQQYYLPTSPEAFLKKMLVAGVGNNFATTKSFRNSEPESRSHQLEFTLLEWYELGCSLEEMMTRTTELITYIHTKAPFPFTVPLNWKRVSVRQALLDSAGFDIEKSWDSRKKEFSLAALLSVLPKEFHNPGFESWDEAFDHLILTYVEPSLPHDEPVFLYNYPRHSTPLAKPVRGETTEELLWSGRFELYWGGYELCDAYWEQTDYKQLQKSFQEQEQKLKSIPAKTAYPSDTDFLEAIKEGMPDCSGNALGIDRLALLHSGCTELPTMH